MTKQYVENEKLVYIISDGIGQSAINLLKASMIQFDFPSSALRIFSRIDNEVRIRTILEQAKEDNAFVAFTIVKREIRKLVHEICLKENLLHLDILGPPIEKLSAYLGVEPKEDANLLRKVDSNYFKRIDAIEFSMKYDDGQDVNKVFDADIIILGLSRTSKTPTSYFWLNRATRLSMSLWFRKYRFQTKCIRWIRTVSCAWLWTLKFYKKSEAPG